ncbi:MAG: AMP-binding protein [Rothia sp. (in: high G+C Gram-positive bacteria)]|nr:AMP-binding protein [Rothia sp. (in: high G+C Gram-positive bacteria)]
MTLLSSDSAQTLEPAQTSADHNLAQLLAARAESADPALLWDGGQLSYQQLAQQVGLARSFLQAQGLQAGQRLALALPNLPLMPQLTYAALSLGLVLVPLHPLLSASEVAYQLADSQASLLLAGEGTRPAQEVEQIDQILADTEGLGPIRLQVVDPLGAFLGQNPQGQEASQGSWQPLALASDAPALILYTSGTTGQPKGATLSHANLLSNALTCAQVFDFQPEDRVFGGLPFFHAFGLTVSLNAVFAAGASVALLPRFSPQAALELIGQLGVNVLAAVPTMYGAMSALLAQQPELAGGLKGQIRFGISGGAALPASIHSQLHEQLSFPIYEGYGLSETSPVVSFNQARFGLLLGSVGRALPGVQVQVVDRQGQVLGPDQLGELEVAGPNVMLGYWGRPEASEAVRRGPWLATGDLARIDAEGNIFIVDRMKDLILRNGLSVYPRQIEDLLDTHPLVAQVAVVGQPDSRVGEEIVACIVPLRPLGQEEAASLEAELDLLARQQLAAYKYPRRYVLMDSFPLGPSGKVLKRQLAALLAQQAGPQ